MWYYASLRAKTSNVLFCRHNMTSTVSMFSSFFFLLRTAGRSQISALAALPEKVLREEKRFDLRAIS